MQTTSSGLVRKGLPALWAWALAFLPMSIARAQILPTPALPDFRPVVGDPRLEPIPGNPIRLVNVPVDVRDDFGVQRVVTMRFPPRVNGQSASDGDGHADMYVLFDAATGQRIDQPPIIEAVPNGATGSGATVSDLKARLFSSVWELQAVTVGPVTTTTTTTSIDPITRLPVTKTTTTVTPYNPNDPAIRIDSAIKVTGPGASPFVRKIVQTNIFLNCPIVPAGTVIDPVPGGPVANEPRVRKAFFEGQIVNFVPYDIEDGPDNPQVLFNFVDASGNVVNRVDDPRFPFMVASRAPGAPFYSPIWEIWTVHVPNAATVKSLNLRSKAAINAALARGDVTVTSSGLRMNCPVVAVDGVPVPFEDAFALLAEVTSGANFLPVDIPPTENSNPRTHLITEVNLPILAAAPAAVPSGLLADRFPAITPVGGGAKGNVIPLIFKNPLQLRSSGPTTAGEVIRINQADLDAAFGDGRAPRLPAAFEKNFSDMIAGGLLDPSWAPGIRPYQDRLALLGRAFFELVFKPEQGANSKDVTRCFACHSTSDSGGSARALYILEAGNELVPGRPEFGRVTSLKPGSMWGGGGSELLLAQRKAQGQTGLVPGAHGSKGTIASLRGVTAGAFNTHLGIQSNEFIAGQPIATLQANCPLSGFSPTDTFDQKVAKAVTCDLDHDGVVNEMTVGEVTAVAEFFINLRVPNQVETSSPEPQTARLLAAMGIGIDDASVENGRGLFRNSIDKSGAACASCHTIFHPLRAVGSLQATTFFLDNPETHKLQPINVSHHSANQVEVNSGLAAFVGEPGMRLLGDQRLHNMGSQMTCSAGPVLKTAELWDIGSTFPHARCGQFGSDLNATILAHEGSVLLNDVASPKVSVKTGPVVDSGAQLSQTLTITNVSGSAITASSAQPIRLVLVGSLTPGIQAANADGRAPDGELQQGAFWLISNGAGSIAPGGSETRTLVFDNPLGKTNLFYRLAIQDGGFSEAVASIQAYKELSASQKADLIDYLRVQFINGKVGEGSGGVQGKPGVVP
jgi:hypothetical protein